MQDVMMVMREGEKNRTVACSYQDEHQQVGRLCVDLEIDLAQQLVILCCSHCITISYLIIGVANLKMLQCIIVDGNRELHSRYLYAPYVLVN